MFRPRIMTGKSCVLVFQFVRFLFLPVRHDVHDALVLNFGFKGLDTERYVFAIIGEGYTHFKRALEPKKYD
ncbi:hypothetical protein [Sphingobacterium siyangense]|uniref:hypothetical protein n=1 Tax=Sphingobacterium siyangense TaxID=459529 RepID=UPI003DA4145B